MTNHRHTEEHIASLKDLKLSESSRARIKKDLLAYAQFHSVEEGVRVGDSSRSIEQVPTRTSLVTRIFNLKPKSMTAAILTLALVVSGGTAFAAENAVPGDMLYSVKTEVNENIKSAFALSSEAEASLQARLAAERLEEAEELAAEGELDADTAASISARLTEHYDAVVEHVAASEAGGNVETSAEVRAMLEGSLRAHADILSDLNVRVDGNDGTTLITDIRGYADATADAHTRATATIETSVSAQAAAETAIDTATRAVASAQTELTDAQSDISAEAYARIEARIDAAAAARADATTAFQAEAYREAYVAAQSAVRIATEAKAWLASALRLEIDIGVDSTIDTTLDGVLQSETNTRTDAEADTRTDSDTAENANTSTNTQADVEVGSDASINADTVEVDATTNTSVRSGLSL